MQMKPDLDYRPTIEEVRVSMRMWFAEAMPEYTPEQWQSFKAHLYPSPQPEVRDRVTGPDYEAIYQERMSETMPRNWGGM